MKKQRAGEFPGGPVVRIPGFHSRGPGAFPGWGTAIPLAACCRQKKKKKNPKRGE